LPLGPVVQHTGQLNEIEVVEELWIFGEPQPDLCRNISYLQWESIDGKSQFTTPQEVKVKHFRPA
jgi:hypothetical protein